MSQTPTIGRIVHYRLSAQDVEHITNQRTATGTYGNSVQEGQVTAAVVVEPFEGQYINLHVLLDGPDRLWVTSRHEGTEPGEWSWPPRV